MSAEQLGRARYRQQQRAVRRAVDRAQAAWLGMSPADLDRSWRTTGPLLVSAVTAGQQQSADPAQDYVAAVVAADGAVSRPAGQVNASALVGTAADGRPLMSLLYQPVIETQWRMLAGQSADDALAGALATLLTEIETEVADAGRVADGVGIASNFAVTGYVRVLSPPSCARCAILAGKVFHTAIAFQRHPRCDCVNLPTTEYRDSPLMDPESYFHSLSKAEQNRIFTQAGARAVRDGADLGQVVNARRGMYTAGGGLKATREGTTRRSWYYHQERRRAIAQGLIPPSGKGFRLGAPRLMPEQIYDQAGSRDEVIALLRRYGYLT